MSAATDVDAERLAGYRAAWSVGLVLVASAVLAVVAVGLESSAMSDNETSAELWLPIALLGVSVAACLLWTAELSATRSSRFWGAAALCLLGVFVALGMGAFGVLLAVDEGGAVVWGTSAGLLVAGALTAVVSYWVLRPRDPDLSTERRSRPPRLRDAWHMQNLFPKSEHWQLPGKDDDEAEAVVREIRELEVVSLARASQHRRRARDWQAAQYVIGLPAALFAGLAGASSFADLTPGWQATVGVLGLIGAGLTSLATALNAGRKAEEAKTLEARYESAGRAAHAFRSARGGDEDPEDRAFLDKMLDRLDALAGVGAATGDTPDLPGTQHLAARSTPRADPLPAVE
jgi:hypothetical protein